MKFQATHTITRNGKVIIKKGDTLTQSQVDKKKVSKYVTPYVRGNNTPYTREEVEFIVKSYLRNNSRKGVSDEFFSEFPNTTHTKDSVQIMVTQLEKIDLTRNGGDYHITGSILEISQSISPERFGTVTC